MVRTPGPGRFQLPQLDEKSGLAPRPVRGPAGHRHLQHLVGADALQRSLPRTRRVRQARRMAGRRLSPGVSRHVAGRDPASPHGDAVSQPGQHGRGRVHSRQSYGRRRSAHGLRQDHPFAAHGRRFLRSAHHRPLRRPHALGQISRLRSGFRNQHLADVGTGALRQG